MKKSYLILIVVIILLAVIGYYGFTKYQESSQPDYFELNFVNENLEQWQIDKYTQEFEEIKVALQENEDYLNNWLSLGRIKKQVGDYKGAEEAWIKAGQVRPSNSTSFNNLADLYANFTKEYDKAEAAWLQAIENSIGEDINRTFYRSLFYFYRDNLKDLEKAENILLEGITINPKSDLLTLAGMFYKDQGDNQKAIKYFEEYLKYNPDNELVKKELDKLK